MHNVQSINGVKESKIENLIFDAARDNETRESKTVNGYEIRFTKQHNGMDVEHLAEVFCANGLIGRAVVDKWDI